MDQEVFDKIRETILELAGRDDTTVFLAMVTTEDGQDLLMSTTQCWHHEHSHPKPSELLDLALKASQRS